MADLGSKLGIDQVDVKGAVRELYRAKLLVYTLIDKICRLTALWKSLDPKELLDQLRKGGYRYWGKVR